MKGKSNDFELFLNECQTYVWEWYIPEQKVRFGIPSLNRPWAEDWVLNVKLSTMLESVHPDDIQKVLVRHTSPLYKSEKMFEVDLRLKVAQPLMPEGQTSSGKYEWYGFRGKTITRDRLGRPTYVRGIAINVDQRYRAQSKLIAQKDRQLKNARQQADFSASLIQEVGVFIRTLAENANTVISMADGSGDREERMMCLSELRDQVGHILELTDKVKLATAGNEPIESHDLQDIALWEHLAELQQVYSLKAGSAMKFYFSNLYDELSIHVDIKVLDMLLDNVMASLYKAHDNGCITLSYLAEAPSLHITIAYTGSGNTQQVSRSAFTESSLGLSVCRLMAKRLWGDISIEQPDADRMKYEITLPLDGNRFVLKNDKSDILDELNQERHTEQNASVNERAALPHVLIGMRNDASLYSNQNLFDVTVTSTTEEFWNVFCKTDPDILFIDSSLPGTEPVLSLLPRLHEKAPDTPIIVTDNYAQRPLHKQVRQLGARYLISNPLSLRKVNMMIKKYLK